MDRRGNGGTGMILATGSLARWLAGRAGLFLLLLAFALCSPSQAGVKTFQPGKAKVISPSNSKYKKAKLLRPAAQKAAPVLKPTAEEAQDIAKKPLVDAELEPSPSLKAEATDSEGE